MSGYNTISYVQFVNEPFICENKKIRIPVGLKLFKGFFRILSNVLCFLRREEVLRSYYKFHKNASLSLYGILCGLC